MSQLYCTACWLPNCVHWRTEIKTTTISDCFCCSRDYDEYIIECINCKKVQKVVPEKA